MALVIDTDVFSFIFKRDTRGALYEPHLKNHFTIVSFMTVAEIEAGTLRANWSANNKARLDKFLRRHHVSYPTRRVCELWAQIGDDGRRTGKNIDHADAWIAATALYFDVPLVTHNGEYFKYVNGLNVISEH